MLQRTLTGGEARVHALAARRARVLSRSPPKIEGAGNAGCALHPRSRVQKVRIWRTRAYRFSGNTPASPAQWLYGLWRDLLGDEFGFVTVAGELAVLQTRSGLRKPPPT